MRRNWVFLLKFVKTHCNWMQTPSLKPSCLKPDLCDGDAGLHVLKALLGVHLVDDLVGEAHGPVGRPHELVCLRAENTIQQRQTNM